MENGITIVDQYIVTNNQIELIHAEIEDIKANLEAKENELLLYENQIATLRTVAPDLINALEKEYSVEVS